MIFFLPSPLVGEGAEDRRSEAGEGFFIRLGRSKRPLTRLASLATLSHKGRGIRSKWQ